MGNYEVIPANTRVNVTFDVEMAGSGSAGTAPKYGPILKACGLIRNSKSSTSVTYAPVSLHHQIALHCLLTMMVLDIKLQVLEVHLVLSCEVNNIPRISFSLTGIFNAPTDTALPTVTVSNQASPLIFKNGSTSNFSIFGFAAALQSWNLDFNNEVIYRELVGGTKEVLITDRRPSGTAVIEAVALSIS